MALSNMTDTKAIPRRPSVWRYWIVGLLVLTLGLPLTLFSGSRVVQAVTLPPLPLASPQVQPTLAASRTISATFAWGSNSSGQLGDGTTTDHYTPVTITMPAGVNYFTQISMGYRHTLGVGDDGQLYAWGYNGEGQLGNGTNINQSTPIKVTLPAGVTHFT